MTTLESPYAEALASIPVSQHEIDVLGSTTRYWVYGPEDADWTVVLCHGYRGEHHGLEPVIAHLPGIRFVSPDLPGFGESTPLSGEPHSVDGYARWYEAFLDALGLTGSAIVLGHSFGTIITSRALATGLETPALILVNPIAVPGAEGPRRFATWLTVSFYRLASRLPERLATAMLGNWVIVRFMSVNLVKTKDRSLRRWVHEQHHTYFSRFSDRDTVVEAFDASMSHSVSDFAADIDVPTLLVAAEDDDITPVAAQYTLQRMFPRAQLRVLADVGHLIHYEAPDRAAAAIRDFLDALPRP